MTALPAQAAIASLLQQLRIGQLYDRASGDARDMSSTMEEAVECIEELLAATPPNAALTPLAAPQAAEPKMVSVGHQYLFTSPYGDVWRDDTNEWNGDKPKASREIFAALASTGEGAQS